MLVSQCVMYTLCDTVTQLKDASNKNGISVSSAITLDWDILLGECRLSHYVLEWMNLY